MLNFKCFFLFFCAWFASFLACDLQINCKTLFRFFKCCFPIILEKKCCKKKGKNKTLTPCFPLNPARGNKSQSSPKFLDFMLIFFTSDAQFLAHATKFHSRKICPEVHSLKFTSFLSPIVSHLDSCHLSYPY